jgi:hypothetical protein
MNPSPEPNRTISQFEKLLADLARSGVDFAVVGGILSTLRSTATEDGPPETASGFSKTREFPMPSPFERFIRRAGRTGSTAGEDARRYYRRRHAEFSNRF